MIERSVRIVMIRFQIVKDIENYYHNISQQQQQQLILTFVERQHLLNFDC